MARVTPQQAAEKWQRKLSAAGTDIANGVQRVTEAPTAAAARNVQGYINGVNEAVQSGKWQAGLQRVTLQQWQSQMTNVGIPRIASGATAAVPKFQAFMTDFLPYEDQGVAQVRAMPNASLEDGIARANAMIRWNAGYRRGR